VRFMPPQSATSLSRRSSGVSVILDAVVTAASQSGRCPRAGATTPHGRRALRYGSLERLLQRLAEAVDLGSTTEDQVVRTPCSGAGWKSLDLCARRDFADELSQGGRPSNTLWSSNVEQRRKPSNTVELVDQRLPSTTCGALVCSGAPGRGIRVP